MKTFMVKVVRDDGKTFEKDVKAINRHAAYTTAFLHTPAGWADGHGVEIFVDGTVEKGNY